MIFLDDGVFVEHLLMLILAASAAVPRVYRWARRRGTFAAHVALGVVGGLALWPALIVAMGMIGYDRDAA